MSDREKSASAHQRRDAPLVLLIEDEPDIANLVQIMLRGEGYDVRWCEGGVQGLAEAVELRPDVVVLDLTLPDADGRKILRSLRENPHTQATPVIISSAMTQPLTEAESSLVKHILLKPFGFDDLLRAVTAAIASPSKPA